MIPWFTLPSLKLGPLTLEPFGLLAAVGIYAAAILLSRAARKQGLDDEPLRDYATWGVIAGLVSGHLVHLFFYHPEELRQHGPIQILKLWDGQSSFGGLFGGIVAAAVYFHRKKIPFSRYADAFALGVAPGWAIARAGCFAVHDHPGKLTSFPLAVQFPGGARHDLGFYDMLALAGISVVLYALRNTPAMRGKLLGVLAVLYGICRFLFDFLRATDVAYADARYLGLTPAQYGCIGIVAYGIYVLTRPPQADATAAGAVVASGASVASSRDLQRK